MFILGNPVTTPIGTAYPLLVKDYQELSSHLSSLTLDKSQLISFIQDIAKENKGLEPFVEMVEESTLYEFMMAFAVEEYRGTFLYEIYAGQQRLFEYFFKEDVISKIESEEDFEYYRELIKAMNDITYAPPNPNPELARLDRLKTKLMEMKGENITFEAMFTSVLLSSGVAPNELTLYQFNKAFDRITHYKNYDTSTLFKTVDSGGKMDIQPWYGTTSTEEPGTITEEQLDSARKQGKDSGLASDL